MQPNHWLPLTEYALRSGMSISTLRRKIKSNAIQFRMEDGRYLIRMDDLEEEQKPSIGFTSNDAPRMNSQPPITPPSPARSFSPAAYGANVVTSPAPKEIIFPAAALQDEIQQLRQELSLSKDEGSLRWRALEARVAGIAKKLDFFTEQMGELKMLVKIFEEKLDERA